MQDNGGPTLTHALLPGSLAIDHIPPEDCIVDADQRGVARPQGTGCDIGAYEFGAEPSGERFVTGVVMLEGRTDHSGAKVAFSGQDPVFTVADGSFQVQLPSRTYDVTVEKDGFLTATKRELVVDQDMPLLAVNLLGGDVNGDGVIDVSDLVLPAKNLGRTETPWQ